MKMMMSKLHGSFFVLATMVALLFSQSMVIPVISTTPTLQEQKHSGGHHHATTPTINCNNPPSGGHPHDPTTPTTPTTPTYGSPPSGHHHDPPTTPTYGSPPSGHHHDPPTTPVYGSPPSGHHGGGGYYNSPPTYTPTPTTPTTPTPTPIIDPGTPSTPTYTPSPPTSYSPPSGTPPYYAPPSYTPPSAGSPPFPFDPNTPPSAGTPPSPSGLTPSSPPFPCNFWSTHPAIVWGLAGWNGNTIRRAFGSFPLMPGFGGLGSNVNSLMEALANTRTDGMGELYREGTAAMLNSMVSRSFPYTTQQVRDSFVRSALGSDKAAAAQARLFKLANNGGHLKPKP